MYLEGYHQHFIFSRNYTMDFILYFATDIARRIFISEEAGRLGFTRIDLLDDSAVCVCGDT